jgi:MFS family permease
MVRTFSSLSHPVFRRYFIAMLFHTAAFNMHQITNPLLVYRITGSAALLGVVSLAGSIPHIFFALLGGSIADRMHKKHILFATLAAFAAVALNLSILLTFGILNPSTWWILLINAVLQSSLMGLMIPTRHAIIREIVSGEQLMNAVALNSMGANVFLLLAPAAAGFIIDGFEYFSRFEPAVR